MGWGVSRRASRTSSSSPSRRAIEESGSVLKSVRYAARPKRNPRTSMAPCSSGTGTIEMPSASKGPCIVFRVTLGTVLSVGLSSNTYAKTRRMIRNVSSLPYGQRRPLPDIEWANVIKPENMVGMSMRQQDRIEAVDAGAQCLLAEIRRGIDDHVLPVAREQQGRAEPFIPRIIRTANAAVAAQRGNAHGCAGSQNRNLEWSRRHGDERTESE